MAERKAKSDEQLLREAAGRDEAPFAELVERYSSRVLGLCRKYVHDPVEAEDVAQEVFLQVWRKASSFRHQALFSTWIYRVAVNLSLNRCRQKGRLITESLDEPPGESGGTTAVNRIPAPESTRPDISWEREETTRRVRQAIDRLPEKQRTAIILTRLEEHSYQETARIMGTSVASVESLVFRAKQNLRRKIHPSPGGRKGFFR